MKQILSVCRGNIARSVVAESLISKELEKRGLGDDYMSISRGIQGTSADPQPVLYPNLMYYSPQYEDSKPALEELGVDISSHVSQPIDLDCAEKSSVILAMGKKTLGALHVLFPDKVAKMHLLSGLIGMDTDIIDPEGASGAEHQEQIFFAIRDIIVTGFPRLLSMAQEG